LQANTFSNDAGALIPDNPSSNCKTHEYVRTSLLNKFARVVVAADASILCIAAMVLSLKTFVGGGSKKFSGMFA